VCGSMVFIVGEGRGPRKEEEHREREKEVSSREVGIFEINIKVATLNRHSRIVV
jgi:hypothetical protein